MPQKSKWVWEAYFVLYLLMATNKIHEFFSPDSQIYNYFQIFTAFEKSLAIIYWLNASQLFLQFFHALPLWLYIHRIPFLKPLFWQWLLIIRIILDISGSSFPKQILASFLHDDPLIFSVILTHDIFFYVPCYVACFLYAFRQKKNNLGDCA